MVSERRQGEGNELNIVTYNLIMCIIDMFINGRKRDPSLTLRFLVFFLCVCLPLSFTYCIL